MKQVALGKVMEGLKQTLESIKIDEAKAEENRYWTGEPSLPYRLEEVCDRDKPIIANARQAQISETWSIIRVPSHGRKIDEMAYTPKIVSTGPFHRDNPALKPMEAHKLRILIRLVQKTHNTSLANEIEAAMRSEEITTRQCYPELFPNMDRHAFVQMMMFDACFIVELFRLNEKFSKGEDPDEPIFGTRWMFPTIARDLLMLENQLPMNVLQKMHALITLRSVDDNPTPLNKLALQFFESFRPCKGEMQPDKRLDGGERSYPHLLVLFQSSFPPFQSSFAPKCNVQYSSPSPKWKDYNSLPGKGWINNARRLTSAGIKLSGRFADHDHPLDLEFKEDTLKIPTLFLDDGTGPLLRNLIAYEQASRKATPYFTCLAVLLDSMVDEDNDIDILRNTGIIKQAKGGNDEILALLNTLNKELEFDMTEDCVIKKTIEDINNFCRTRKARMRIRMGLYLSRVDFLSLLLSYISIGQTIIFASGNKPA